MKKKNPPKQERNKPCACGSGIKYKKCCFIKKMKEDREALEVFYERIRKKREDRIKSGNPTISVTSAWFLSNVGYRKYRNF